MKNLCVAALMVCCLFANIAYGEVLIKSDGETKVKLFYLVTTNGPTQNEKQVNDWLANLRRVCIIQVLQTQADDANNHATMLTIFYNTAPCCR